MNKLSLFSGIAGSRSKSEETRKRMSDSAKKRCTDEWRKKRSEMYSTKLELKKVQEMYDSGMTQKEIADSLGVTQKVIWRFMKNNSIKTRTSAKRNQNGEKNHMWKGGKIKNDAGYIMVRCPDHPRAEANSGYVFEHVLIAEERLGRKLIFFGVNDPRSEVVHHKNEKKYDNRPENLEVMTFSEHVKLHNEMRRSRKGGGANAKGKDNASA